jgi:hypothetical protein
MSNVNLPRVPVASPRPAIGVTRLVVVVAVAVASAVLFHFAHG